MVIKRSTSGAVFDWLNYIFMVLLMLICVYPLYYVLVASLSDSNLLAAHRGFLLAPLGFNLDSYKAVVEYPIITQGYLNTIIIVAVGVSLNLILTMFGAYFLSLRGISLKGPVMLLIMFTMFFSGGLIPFYMTVRGLGLYDTYAALILPGAVSTYNLIIMRTAFMDIPPALKESAEIDGANDLVVLFRIILPVTMPTVAVIILYYGVGHWNSWFNAQIFLKSRKLYPIQLVLREILLNNEQKAGMISSVMEGDKPQIGETIKYATVIAATAPILAIYPFLQKYFVKGIMVGSVKG